MSYRLYTVDRAGRLQPSLAFDCPDDRSAVEQARAQGVLGEAAELWQGGRLLGRFSKLGVFTAAAEGQAAAGG
jgi:hypothetical protein